MKKIISTLSKASLSLTLLFFIGCSNSDSDVDPCENKTGIEKIIPVHASSLKANNGNLIIYPDNPLAKVSYSIDGVKFQDSNTFRDLAPNEYSVSIKDANGCISSETITVEVHNIFSLSYKNDIAPILQTNCNSSSCHGQNRTPLLTSHTQVKANADKIKTAIQNGSMPKGGTLSSTEIAAISSWVDAGSPNN